MSYAFVKAGALAIPTTSPVTPAFGQATTAGNLLVCLVGSSNGNAFTTSSSGWVDAVGTTGQGHGTGAETGVFYKPNCGAGEAAPSIAQTAATQLYAFLLEFSGGATSSPVDQNGKGSSQTATNPSADVASGELVVGCFLWVNSKTATYTVTDAFTPSGGAISGGTGSEATKALTCFHGAAYITTSHASADGYSPTVTPSTGALSLAVSNVVSFKLGGGAGGPILTNVRVLSQAVQRASSW